VESPRIDDLGSPRGTGRPETGRSAECAAVAIVGLDVGDRETEELARDGPVEAVLGDARSGVSEAPPGLA